MASGAVGVDALGGGVEGGPVEIDEGEDLGLLGGERRQEGGEAGSQDGALGGVGLGRQGRERSAGTGLEAGESGYYTVHADEELVLIRAVWYASRGRVPVVR